ncbi:Cation efflux family protein [Brugia pahangi]
MSEEERKTLLGNEYGNTNSYSQEFPTKYTVTNQSYQVNVSFWKKRQHKKLLRKYNEHQQRLQLLYLHDEQLFTHFLHGNATATNNEEQRKRNINSLLAGITFATNVILLFANGIASVLSGSLSIISTFLDSAVDCISGVLIYISTWAINNTDTFNYPRGRARLELIIVLICSVIMGVANIMMIIQSVESIVNKSIYPNASVPTICILVIACAIKVLLMIFCYRHGTPGSRTLAMDQRNDIITSAVALISAFIGDKYWLYADPIGAICVCTFVACSWFFNAADNIPMLVGKRGDQENLSRIIRICVEHDEHIKCLDHVMVYHTGSLATVEVHIVLDDDLPLKITHDIIESLTKKISVLPFVERAFVHGDYRCDGDWAE